MLQLQGIWTGETAGCSRPTMGTRVSAVDSRGIPSWLTKYRFMTWLFMFVQISPLHLLQAIHLRPAAKEGVIDHPTPSLHTRQSAVPLHLEESSPVRSRWTAEVAVDALDLARRSHVLVCQRDIANTNMAKVLWEVL